MAVVAVLGPTLIDDVTPPPLRARVLATLIALRGCGATVPELVQHAWAQSPRTARASLHNQVTALRRLLGEESLLWDGERYRVAATVRTDLDALHADIALVDAARRRGDPEAVVTTARTALARFRGGPFADLSAPRGVVARTVDRVSSVRAQLEETWADALGATDRVEESVDAWRRLVAEQPFHEGRWAGLVAALDACGRRADALNAYREARQTLRDNLGLSPGAVLESAHGAVLRGPRPALTPSDGLVSRPRVISAVFDALASHRVVAVVGPAGAGKSTLLHQLQHPGLGTRTVRIDCGSSPWTALEPLHELLDAVGAPPLQHGDVAEDVPGRAAAAIAAAADERPLLVAIDDAAAGGPTTWQTLALAMHRSSQLQLVLACRPGEALPTALGAITTVELPAFDTAEVRELTELLLQQRGRADTLADWLAGRTGGNPLFVRELVLDLRHRGQLRQDESGHLRPPERLVAPERLQGIVGQRLGTLGLRARRACDVLATVAPLDDAHLLDALGVAHGDLQVLRDAHVLAPGPTVAFAHDALQEVARELTPPGRRIEVALVAADAMASLDAHPAAIARLRLAATEVAPRAAALACLEAARAATEERAFGEAVRWADDGIAVLPLAADPLAVELAVLGADAARLGGHAGHADRLLRAAEMALDASSTDMRRRATLALLRLGECCQPGPVQARAVALARRSLELEHDPDHAARIEASLSLTHSMVDPVASLACIERALARLEEHDDDALAIDVLPYTYMSLGTPDDLHRRAAAAARLRDAAERLDDPAAAFEADHLRFSWALACGTRAELDGAHARMEATREVVTDAGRRWSLHYQRATMAQLAGDIAEATALAVAARDVGVTVAPTRAWATWAAQMLELHRLSGTLEELAPTVLPLVDAPDALPAWRAAVALVLAPTEPSRAVEVLTSSVPALLDGPHDFSTTAALQTAARAAAMVKDRVCAGLLLPRLLPHAELWSWQGTTTYGPIGDVVAELGEVLDRPDAVDAGTSGARAARERLGVPDYP